MKPVRSEVKHFIRGNVAVIYDGTLHGAVMYDVSEEIDEPTVRAVDQLLVPLLRKLK